jgi:hypothetical protein
VGTEPAVELVHLAGLVTGREAWDGDESQTGQWLDVAVAHGVHALLHRAQVLHRGADAISRPLRDAAMAQAIWELAHQQVAAKLISALRGSGIDFLVLKGTALAYTIYDDPSLRCRSDTDLLVREPDLPTVRALLNSLGFVRMIGAGGRLASYQETHTIEGSDRARHAVDLHWKLNNSQLLSRLFSFEELFARSVPVHRLEEGARTTGYPDALIIACMHLATHRNNPMHFGDTTVGTHERLIWLHDIAALASRFSEAQWQQVAAIAIQKGMGPCCADGLRGAGRYFFAPVPANLLLELGSSPGLASIYLGSNALRQRLMDLAALDGLGSKARWLFELVFPSAEFMRSRYRQAKVQWLPWLYLRRCVRAGVKLQGRAWRALPNVESILTIRAWLGLWLMWLRLRVGSKLLQGTSGADQPVGRTGRTRAIQISTAVSRAARYLPVPSTCLSRSLVLHSLLAREGVDASLRIGVRTEKGGLEAHAWVEFEGSPLNDRNDIATSYPPFEGAVSPRGFFGS